MVKNFNSKNGMEPTAEELLIANRHQTVKGEEVDHLCITYTKPWGKEFIVNITPDTAVWILNIKANMSTSLNCHFKKDTVLVGLSGCTRVGLGLDGALSELYPLQSLLIPKKKFHSVGAFDEDVWVMEIEVFGEEKFSNKNDLLRLDDAFCRPKTGYESSAKPTEGCPWLPWTIDGTVITRNPGTINFLVSGMVRRGEFYLGPGSRVTSGNLISVTRHGYVSDQKIIWGEEHLKLKGITGVVMTSGCFDILHAGHIKLLQEAASLGPLLVCLSSDSQISRIKGPGRPVNTFKDRLAVLKSLECVTWVMVYEETDDNLEETLDRLINRVRPSVWVKGSEYTECSIFNKHPSLSSIHLVNMLPGISTTNILTTHGKDKPCEIV